MATVNQPTKTQTRPTVSARPTIKNKIERNAGVLFTKENHKWMIIAGALMVLGFIAMSGGKSVDPTQFNPKQVYSTMRITIAPLLILLGLSTFVYAIMKKGTKA